MRVGRKVAAMLVGFGGVFHSRDFSRNVPSTQWVMYTAAVPSGQGAMN